MRRVELLVAEIPASLVEAFPILGIGGVLVTNAGLAVAMPRMIPAIAVITATSVLWFIATMFIASALITILGRSRVVSITAIAGVFALAAWAGVAGIRAVFRLLKTAINVWLPAAVDILPLTRGYEGVITLHDGATRQGLTLIATYVAATALLLAIAVPLHARRVSAQVERSPWRFSSARPLRFDTPAAGIGTVYFRQLLGSSLGRTGIVVALFMTGSLAFVAGILRAAGSEGTGGSVDLTRAVDRLQAVPWFALFPLFVIVVIASQIWTNQFGFDAGSLRGILALPVSPEQVLLGKAFGLTKYFAVQVGAALLPVLAFAPATLFQAISGAAVAVIAAMIATIVGQGLSVRFPRSFTIASAGGTLPLVLSWIPFTMLVLLLGLLFVLHTIGELVSRGGGTVILVAVAIGACVAYRAVLPRLAALMTEHRERLVMM